MYYNTKEASIILGYTSETIRKKIKRGELSCFKIGNTICIPKEEIQKYLNDRLSTNGNTSSNKEEIIEKLVNNS